MFFVTDKIVVSMALLRVLSGLIELTAAFLIFKIGKIDTALKINASLAFIGPTIMILVTTIGVIGLAGKVPIYKMFVIFVGVCLIFWGVNKV